MWLSMWNVMLSNLIINHINRYATWLTMSSLCRVYSVSVSVFCMFQNWSTFTKSEAKLNLYRSNCGSIVLVETKVIWCVKFIILRIRDKMTLWSLVIGQDPVVCRKYEGSQDIRLFDLYGLLWWQNCPYWNKSTPLSPI